MYEHLAPEPEDDVFSLGQVALAMLTGDVRPAVRAATSAPVSSVDDQRVQQSWAPKYATVLRDALAGERGPRPGAQSFAEQIAAAAWGTSPPPHILALLANPAIRFEAETIALSFSDSVASDQARRPASGEIPDMLQQLSAGSRSPAREPAAQGILNAALLLARRRTRDPRALVAAGRVLERHGRREADVAFEHAAAEGDPIALVREALRADVRGDARAAGGLWERAGRNGSQFALERQAVRAIQDGRPLAAALQLEASARRGKTHAAFALLQLHRIRKDDEAARRALLLAAALDHPAACTELGVAAEDAGRISEAERLYWRADRAGGAESARRQGLLDERRGDLDLAIASFERAVERGNCDADACLARVLIADGRTDRAEAILRAGAQRAFPGCALALAELLWDRSDARSEFLLLLLRRACEEPPTRGDAWSVLSERLLMADDAAGALAVLRSAPAIAGDTDCVPRRALLTAAALATTGDLRQAGTVLAQASDVQHGTRRLAAVEPLLGRMAFQSHHAAKCLADLAWYRAGEPGPGTEGGEVADLYVPVMEAVPHAAAMVAWLSEDPARKRRALELAVTAGNSWATYEMAFKEGADKVAFIEKAAELGNVSALEWLASEFEETDPERALTLLGRSDALGSATGARRLGYLLRKLRGARDPEVAAAFSRADLRGDAVATCELSMVERAAHGHDEFAERICRRDARRTPGTGSQRLGVYLENVGMPREAEAAFKAAVAAGSMSAWSAIATAILGSSSRVSTSSRLRRLVVACIAASAGPTLGVAIAGAQLASRPRLTDVADRVDWPGARNRCRPVRGSRPSPIISAAHWRSVIDPVPLSVKEVDVDILAAPSGTG